MNRDMRKAIAELAEVFRSTFGLSIPITKRDLMKVIEKIGGTISVDSSLRWTYKIIKTSDDSFTFVVPLEYERYKDRQVFELAHLLGSLLLFGGYLTDKETWDAIPVGELK